MADRSQSDSSFTGKKLEKQISISRLSGRKQRRQPNEPTPKASAPLVDHANATVPQTTKAQNDEIVSILSVVERLEVVKPSATGFSETKDADVLSGRGGGTNLHPGNRFFRQLIVSHSNAYDEATKSKKPLVARDVVQQIRQRGGRFLRKDSKDGLFYEIGDDLAREKASQAFRHRTFELRKQRGPHDETAIRETAPQIHPGKRMRTISANQHPTDKKADDVSKRQKKGTGAYPARKTHCDGHVLDSVDKDHVMEELSTRSTSKSVIAPGQCPAAAGMQKEKEEKKGTISTGAPSPPPWAEVNTLPSYHFQSGGPMSQLLSGISHHPSFLTAMLSRGGTSASGSFSGGRRSSWDPKHSAAMTTRASSSSSVSSSELTRSSRPKISGRPNELTQSRDGTRISSDTSLTAYPATAVDGITTHVNGQNAGVNDGTNRAAPCSSRTTLFQPRDSSGGGGLRFLPSSTPHDARFLPQGFQSSWPVFSPLSNQHLLFQQPSLAAVAGALPLSTQSAAAAIEYQRSLFVDYIMLRRIQQERATLLSSLAVQQQNEHEQQSEEPQKHDMH